MAELVKCPVCLEYLLLEELELPFNPKIKKKNVIIKLPCQHKVCRPCLTPIVLDISKTRGKEFRCIQPDCNKPYDPYGLITKQQLKYYLKINEDPTKIKCPKKGCSGEIAKFMEKYRCNQCFSYLCSACFELKTDNHKCLQENIENIKYILQYSKPCPKCYLIIFKDGGCDHMYCQVCQTHFDWKTMSINQVEWNPNPVVIENEEELLEQMGIRGLEMIRRRHAPKSEVNNLALIEMITQEEARGCLMCRSTLCLERNSKCCWCMKRVNLCDNCRI